MDGLRAVSYTHLDVYKRQLWNFVLFSVLIIFMPFQSQKNTTRYLWLSLDTAIKYETHCRKERGELGIKFKMVLWLIEKNSSLPEYSKFVLCTTYERVVSNFGVLGKKGDIIVARPLRNEVLRSIVDAPWFSRNNDFDDTLKIVPVTLKIQTIARKLKEIFLIRKMSQSSTYWTRRYLSLIHI